MVGKSNAGFRGLVPRSAKRTAAYRRQRQANALAESFITEVILMPGCEHSLGHTRQVLTKLLATHSHETVAGLVRDVAFLSDEAIAGRARFKIESAGLLYSLVDDYAASGYIDVAGRRGEDPDTDALTMVSLE